jgi:AraC-like DNA-binding protein
MQADYCLAVPCSAVPCCLILFLAPCTSCATARLSSFDSSAFINLMPRQIETFVPPPPLSAFINQIWAYEGYEQPHELERVLPDGSMEIIINLAEDATRMYDPEDGSLSRSFPGSIVSGAHSGHFVIDTFEQRSVVGVSFKPGGAPPFLGLPAAELQDAHMPLDALWDATFVAVLRERLLEAGSMEARLAIAEEALLQQANGNLARHPAVTYALNQFQGVPQTRTVANVTEQVGLSPRRFIRLFDQEVGLTPKLYCRVRRFQKALRVIQAGRVTGWTDIALRCGYYDQAHLIRDFQEFSGLTPTAYAAQRGEHLNHVPLPD